MAAMKNKHPLAVWRESQNPPVPQHQVATLVGVSRWTINSIETGRRMAGRDLIAAIQTATNGGVGFDAFTSKPERKMEKTS